MPTIGLIVEGECDKAALPVLLQKCRAGVRVEPRKCRGSVTGRLSGILAELERSCRAEKVLIVSDADGQEPRTVLSLVQSRVKRRYPFSVVPLVIVEKLEAWLIADPGALERVLRVKTSFRSPETIPDPKAELCRLLRPRIYTPAIAHRIAEEIDLRVLAQRCTRFKAFRDAVLR